MKRLEDYTEMELADMTDEQIKTLVALEAAEEGIEYSPDPGECPASVEVERDIVAYGVSNLPGRYGNTSINFSTEEAARTFIDTLASEVVGVDYNYNIGSQYQYAMERGDEVPLLSKIYLYSKPKLDAVAASLTDNKKAREEHKKLSEAHAKYIAAVDAVYSDVMSKVNSAKWKKREIVMAKEKLAEFVALASNDNLVAKRFFLNAYKSRPDICAAVFPEEYSSDVPSEANN